MTMEPHDLRDDLEPHDADALLATGTELRRSRPVPAAAFRGDLRRRLMGRHQAAGVPRRLWVWVAGSGSLGSTLLAVAAAGVAGIGPFAP